MTPILETERLILRGHTLDDFPDCAALWADPEVVKYLGAQPSTPEQAWARVLRYVGHWTLLGYGFWVVTDRATGRFAGEIGMANFQREIEPPIGERETGWVFAPWAHGRGLATEALRAVLAWTDTKFPGEPSACVIDPPNVASRRVAEKCGYVEERRAIYQGVEVVVFRRQSPAHT